MSTCPRCGRSTDTGTASFTSLTSTGLPFSSLAQTRSSATPFSSQSLSEVARTIATPPTDKSSNSLFTETTAESLKTLVSKVGKDEPIPEKGLPFSSLAQARSSATPFSSQSLSEVARTIATPPTDKSSNSLFTATTAESLKTLVNEVGKDELVPEKVCSLTMTSPDIVQKSVEATFKEMKKYSLKAYVKTEADPLFKEFITKTATFAARKEVSLDRVFLENPEIDVVSLLTKNLSMESIQLIQKAFTIPTFDMTLEKILKGDKEVIFAMFKMEDKEFLPPVPIETRDDIDVAKDRQYASILHDALAFSLDVCEVKNHISKAITKSAIEKAATWIKESLEIREALENFVESWRRAGNNNREKAKAVYVLLKDAVASDQLSMVLQIYTHRNEMSCRDWAEAFAKVSATIMAAYGNGGGALTARIFLALTSGHNLQKRIWDLRKLEEVEKNLPESKKTDAVCIMS